MRKKLLKESLAAILKRYQKYEDYLHYPGEWGERAFRAWLVFEIFHGDLQWPISNIVFGERFDVLFVDDAVKPVIYLETKKPGRGLADMDACKERTKKYETLVWVVLTDGFEWMRMNCVKNEEQSFSVREVKPACWRDFFQVFESVNYLYGVQNVKSAAEQK